MLHRVLIVGTGSIGTRHVRCMLNTGRAEVGICEPDAQLRQKVAAEYGITEAYASVEQALEQHWGAAVVAVPAPLHVSITHQLVDHGIAVLIEKPLAVDETGLTHLYQTVEQGQIPCGVAYIYRAHPAARAMRDAIQAGQFGEPLQLICVSGQPFAHLRPAYRDIYYAKHEQGGGAIQDGLTHGFNLCEWLVGPITRIAVDAAHMRLEGIDVEDTVNVLARHNDTVMASYAVNHHQAPNEAFIMVVCEEGTLRLEIKDHRWRWMDQPNGKWNVETAGIAEYDEWFTLQEQAFLDYVEGDAAPLCSLAEGWQTLRVNRAALKSARDAGAWQVVEPVHLRGSSTKVQASERIVMR